MVHVSHGKKNHMDLTLLLWYMYLMARKTIWTLRNYDGDGNENNKKVIGLISKTTPLHMHHAFSNDLCNNVK